MTNTLSGTHNFAGERGSSAPRTRISGEAIEAPSARARSLSLVAALSVLGQERRGVVLVLLVVLVPVVRVRVRVSAAAVAVQHVVAVVRRLGMRFAGGSGEWRALPGAGGVETSLRSAGAGEGCLVGALRLDRRLGRQLGSRHGGWVAASVGESVPRPGDEVMGWHLGHFHQLFSPESVSTVWRGVFPTSSNASGGQPVLSHPFGLPILFESPACNPNVEFLPTPCLLREMQSFESGLTAKQADLQSVHHGTRPPSAFCIRDSTSAASFLSGFDAPRYRQTTQQRQRTIRGSPSRTLVENHSNKRSVQRPERQVPVPLLKLSFEDGAQKILVAAQFPSRTLDLCHLLICPFHWALQQPTSPQDEVVHADLCGAPVLAPHFFHGGRLLPRPQRSLRLLSLECPHTLMVPVSHGERVSAPRQQMWGKTCVADGSCMDVPPWHEPEHGLWAARRGASVNYIAHQRDGQRRRRGAARSYAAVLTKVAAVANVQGRECQAMVYWAPLADLAKLTEKEVVQSRDGEFRVCLEGQHWHGCSTFCASTVLLLRVHLTFQPLLLIAQRGWGASGPADRGPINKTLSDLRTNSNSCRKGSRLSPHWMPRPRRHDRAVSVLVRRAILRQIELVDRHDLELSLRLRGNVASPGARGTPKALQRSSGDRTYLGAPDAPLPEIDTSSPQMTNRGYAAVFSDVSYILFTVVSSPGTKKQKRRVSSELLRDAASSAASRPMLSRSACLAAGLDSKDCISQGRRGVGRNSTLGLRAGDWKRTVGLKGYDRMAWPPDGLHQTGSGEEQRSAISSPLQTRPQAKAWNPQHGETRNRQRSRSANIHALGVAWRDPLGATLALAR
ncbi:hypothetical protein B0H13DRAFT_1859025 [Mycena leptocephala]|nr:hypothetical protein B0H13DRAFT_1859025 [Mycena leptocephala]